MQMMLSGGGDHHHVFSIPSSLKGFSQDPAHDSNPNPKTIPNNSTAAKKRRNLPGTPDPDAEVIALSPKTLMATNRFVCEICNKGFQRDQNLQLHRRGHNLPWKLKQRAKTEIPKKKVYICPETACVHHDPGRALGDLTGIKKHFSRKHGEKKWKCEKCSKKYAVQSDWKAHSKTCGTREYKCDCGTLFSRKDSFITHRAFCDALNEESARIASLPPPNLNFTNDPLNEGMTNTISQPNLPPGMAGMSQFGGGYRPNYAGMGAGGSSLMNNEQQKPRLSLWLDHQANSQLNPIDMAMNSNNLSDIFQMAQSNLFGSSTMPNFGQPNQSNWVEKNVAAPKSANLSLSGGVSKGSTTVSDQTLASMYSDTQSHRPNSPAPPMSATALLQKAAQMGSTRSNPSIMGNSFGVMNSNSANSNSTTSGFNVLVSNNEANLPMGGSSLSSLTSTTASSNLEQFMMQSGVGQGNSVVPLKLNQGSNRGENGPTRDFLGVGGEGGRRFLPQELAKFASMGAAAMGLGHFTSNH
ncbi:zinc finger protein JACKDAW [Rhododendron vialii]|uniref:zinc finger protein JACKDAW n=1 Tax=Rhododendron vialii TaxID=182163 RepID=UPI00265F9E93|nr:zinc finger protein JACKDAW [Rhododendron vialii]